jgi:hypothetical protein
VHRDHSVHDNSGGKLDIEERSMLGYKVTARCEKRGYTMVYRGYSEGSPLLKAKVAELAAKQVLKEMVKMAGGGGPAVRVTRLVADSLAGFGTALGEQVAQIMLNEVLKVREITLMDGYVVVTLSGKFEGTYRIHDKADLEEFPLLLALNPKRGTEEDWENAEYMGEAVLRGVYRALLLFLGDVADLKVRNN